MKKQELLAPAGSFEKAKEYKLPYLLFPNIQVVYNKLNKKFF